ncbi:MAG: YfcC family protein, partial [Acidobacteriota bacterium]
MSRIRVPHTLILLFAMNVLALLVTYVLPQGKFERAPNESGREQVVAGTYSVLEEGELLTPWQLFTAIPRGFEAAQDIIFFILLIGGAFAVMRATGAIDAALAFLLDVFGHRPLLLIVGTMSVFAFGSSTI